MLCTCVDAHNGPGVLPQQLLRLVLLVVAFLGSQGEAKQHRPHGQRWVGLAVVVAWLAAGGSGRCCSLDGLDRCRSRAAVGGTAVRAAGIGRRAG